MKQAPNEVWRLHWQLANELQGRKEASKWADLCRDTFNQLIAFNSKQGRKRHYAIMDVPNKRNRPAKLIDLRKKEYRQFRDLKATPKEIVTKLKRKS